MKGFLREILGTLALALITFLVLQTALQSYIVVYSSMQPTLEDGQRLLVSKAVYFFKEPQRGDIIVFHVPSDPKIDYIKRVIALPGDTMEVRRGKVYINGTPLDEPYIKASPTYTLREQKIPGNSYFVLGDNRNNSLDSHNGWTVPRQNIIGKAWLSIWPPSRVGEVLHYTLGKQLAGAAP